MRPDFFIFSLPRSGSAWLSVFLTGTQSFCYHEPTADDSAFDWTQKARKRPESIVGAVDTGAYNFAGSIRDAAPHAKIYRLEREPIYIHRSLKEQGIDGFAAGIEFQKMQDATPEAHVIYHDGLGDMAYLEALWDELIGSPFDRERAKLLIEMNIQRDLPRFFAARPHLAVA